MSSLMLCFDNFHLLKNFVKILRCFIQIKMAKTKVGLILASELEDLPIFKNQIERPVTTLFGDPACPIVECTVGHVPCIYLYREGKESGRKPAGKSNHRGNVWALKENGCTHVIGITVDGTLSQEIKPGDIVVLNDFLDCTTGREQTFHDGEFGSPPGTINVPMIPSFSEPLRQCVIDSANQAAIKVVSKGMAAVKEGPCYPTSAEVSKYRKNGASVMNWATSPEAILAKEAGLLYIGLSLVSFDADGKQSQFDMCKTARQHRDNVNELLRVAIDNIGTRDWEKEILALKKELGMDDSGCACKEE